MRRRARKQTIRKKIARLLLWTLLILALVPVGLAALYRVVPPPGTPLMLIRAVEGEGIRKNWVPLDRISPHVIRAVMALEDARFCSHSGFDWNEVAEAVGERLDGGRLRGASTISMQTAKNVFLWPGRDVVRKVIEAPLTLLIELMWGKHRIMEVYLNVAEWGHGVYGIEAAAQTYFGKPAFALNRHEAALLAAVLPNPRLWSPARPTGYIQGRAYTALARANLLDVGCAEA